ncbi:hypothetical protein [Paenibacillus beijingensis]|uniref:HEPN AbiU2-like domain-containing protein n=1 Tax=Paenibacillus beijingensis TaxID=1126833 RepID=A0A0D5NLQ6_9BACL|nr:hypothetical protein [Paenibacillus beijingensis]AJY76176.1 hypothetical protein VN24_18430 [Paenibacillus beijingensis]
MDKTYHIDVIFKQIPLLRDFVYHYVAYKELYSRGRGPEGEEKFWTYIVNAHLSQAIINWVTVFEVVSDQSRWNRMDLKLDPKRKTREEFVSDLLTHIQFTEQEWKQYWNEVSEFRDKFVAYGDILFEKPAAYLDIAYKAARFYDRWIREQVNGILIMD